MPSAIARQLPARVMGIETSCDETAAAVVEITATGDGIIRSNIVRSQIAEHQAFGGVVPEIAARAHISSLDHLCAQALQEADLDWADIDAVAATAGPGLIGGVIVGLTTAKAIALALNKPLFAINHLEGHALTVRLTDGLAFPYLLLLVSGGHTQILLVKGLGNYQRLATTIDDAIGEAFDKTAKLLGLASPGGPAVERAAANGNLTSIELPAPLLHDKRLDMSFSGLKTAVRHAAESRAPLTQQQVADICAAFQKSVADVLCNRLTRAIPQARDLCGSEQLPTVIAGGVAANQYLRARLNEAISAAGSELIAPPPALCTDNAAMIAWAGAERLRAGQADDLSVAPRSRWPLDDASAPVMGHGRRGAKV